jgi:hypothetical protein
MNLPTLTLKEAQELAKQHKAQCPNDPFTFPNSKPEGCYGCPRCDKVFGVAA